MRNKEINPADIEEILGFQEKAATKLDQVKKKYKPKPTNTLFSHIYTSQLASLSGSNRYRELIKENSS